MPLNPLFPCCDFPADVEPPYTINDSGREGACHPTGNYCPKGSVCLTHTEPSDLQPLTVCQCVQLDKNGFVPWEYLLQDPPWTIKGRELLASISDTLAYMVSRTVALKLKSIGWYPTDLSLVELRVLLRTVLTKRGTDYTYSVPSPIPSIPLTPRDKVTACNQRCRDLVYQDFAHQTETVPEFKDRVNKCEFNCLQYFEV